ncbi:MAG TPA: hypothetical protein VFY84_18415 [Jiangellales bacterium]|nr:hypothetical protein [Jiangellales bacterium]
MSVQGILLTPTATASIGHAAWWPGNGDRADNRAVAQQAATDLPTAAVPAIDHSILAGYDAKLDRYRAALEAGAEPAVVAGWIAETQAERKRALDQLAKTTSSPPSTVLLTPEQITTLIDDLGDLVTALKDAEPDHKFEVYRALHLKLIYEPQTETVRAYVDLGQHRGDLVRVRGATRTKTQRGPQLCGVIPLS